MEIRNYNVDEFRAVSQGNKRKLQGYAAVFDSRSGDLGGFYEEVKRGAFSSSLKTNDIRALFNHKTDFVLGRKKSGTLRLNEDSRGLEFEIDMPDTTTAKDLMYSVDRGDIDQMSFGFRTISDNWRTQDGMNLRDLIEVDLKEISVVPFPAYESTSVQARSGISLPSIEGVDIDRLAFVIQRAKEGLPIGNPEKDLLHRSHELIKGLVQEENPSNKKHDFTQESKLSAKWKKLELLGK